VVTARNSPVSSEGESILNDIVNGKGRASGQGAPGTAEVILHGNIGSAGNSCTMNALARSTKKEPTKEREHGTGAARQLQSTRTDRWELFATEGYCIKTATGSHRHADESSSVWYFAFLCVIPDTSNR
jgi:hypothetical protein